MLWGGWSLFLKMRDLFSCIQSVVGRMASSTSAIWDIGYSTQKLGLEMFRNQLHLLWGVRVPSLAPDHMSYFFNYLFFHNTLKNRSKGKTTIRTHTGLSKWENPNPKTGSASLSSLKLCTAVVVGRVAQEKHEESLVDNDDFGVCNASWNSMLIIQSWHKS